MKLIHLMVSIMLLTFLLCLAAMFCFIAAIAGFIATTVFSSVGVFPMAMVAFGGGIGFYWLACHIANNYKNKS